MVEFYKKEKNYYWDLYYKNIKKNFFDFYPSPFAVFFKKKYLNKSINLLEIGCGNGRDTFFFNNKVNNIVALDSSVQAINKNKKVAKINKLKIKFINKDFEDFDYNKIKAINSVYARFFYIQLMKSKKII